MAASAFASGARLPGATWSARVTAHGTVKAAVTSTGSRHSRSPIMKRPGP